VLTPAVFRASGSGDQVAHDVVNGHRLDNGDSITFVALARELVHREISIVPDREPRFGHVQAEVIVGDIARKSPARRDHRLVKQDAVFHRGRAMGDAEVRGSESIYSSQRVDRPAAEPARGRWFRPVSQRRPTLWVS
jgi:hypothetical protein